jgi:hypothetical protein
MITLSTTVPALRNGMSPVSWAKYAQNHGIKNPETPEPIRVVTDTEDLKKYELTPELQVAMAKAERLEDELQAIGFTLKI